MWGKSSMIKRASSGQRQQVFLWRVSSPMEAPQNCPIPQVYRERYFCHSLSIPASGLSLLAIN